MAATYDGILNINKPHGWTSHDVVARVRRLLSTPSLEGRKSPRVGHSGTLDPLATGVLLVCVGNATRVAEYLMASEKRYRAVARLGVVSDTFDIEGRVMATYPVPPLERRDLERALAGYTGEILQIPPDYSAIKQDGVPAYRRARRGESVALPPRRVVIHQAELLEWQSPHLSIEVLCDAGTYVRSLIHDLGQALACGAVLTDLVRLASGAFTLETSITLDTLEGAIQAGEVAQHLLPLEAALSGFVRVPIGEPLRDRLVKGLPILGPTAPAGQLGYAIEEDGEVRAIVVYDSPAALWRPKKVFPPSA